MQSNIEETEWWGPGISCGPTAQRVRSNDWQSCLHVHVACACHWKSCLHIIVCVAIARVAIQRNLPPCNWSTIHALSQVSPRHAAQSPHSSPSGFTRPAEHAKNTVNIDVFIVRSPFFCVRSLLRVARSPFRLARSPLRPARTPNPAKATLRGFPRASRMLGRPPKVSLRECVALLLST